MARDDGHPNSGDDIQGARRLSPNEQAIAAELRRLDPNLAGLFERGLALADEIDEPGVRYLVAHIGREVSRAVVAILTGETTVSPPVVRQKSSDRCTNGHSVRTSHAGGAFRVTLSVSAPLNILSTERDRAVCKARWHTDGRRRALPYGARQVCP